MKIESNEIANIVTESGTFKNFHILDKCVLLSLKERLKKLTFQLIYNLENTKSL